MYHYLVCKVNATIQSQTILGLHFVPFKNHLSKFCSLNNHNVFGNEAFCPNSSFSALALNMFLLE